MDAQDGFILVTKDHKRCAKQNRKLLHYHATNNTNSGLVNLPKRKIFEKMDELVQFESFLSVFERYIDENLKFKSSIDVVCYGLGNFFDCYQAQYQLALLNIILKKLKLLKLLYKIEIFDPHFTEDEKRWLEEHDFRVVPINELALRAVDRYTVFYMPHCGRGLYNNVLYANWSVEQLKNVCIIGNSFRSVIEHFQNHENDRTVYRYINEAGAFCQELLLPYCNEAFEGTSIHWFKETILSLVILNPKCNKQPVYDYGTSEVL